MKLYYHPLSTYSRKVMLAFKEKRQSYDEEVVTLFDEEERKRYLEVYPLGKIPLLITDDERMIPESSIIVEYLDTTFDTGTRLIPKDPEMSRRTRFHDRMMDLYLNENVTTLLFQSWKPKEEQDPERIAKAKFQLESVYGFMNKNFEDKPWMMGDEFTLADCGALPPLFYAQQTAPFDEYRNIVSYWQRAQERPSHKAVTAEATPYWEKMQAKRA